jgi:hypothetical protein
MSSNFERLHEIINEAYAVNFSCLSHWEPKKCHMWESISENPVPLCIINDVLLIKTKVTPNFSFAIKSLTT